MSSVDILLSVAVASTRHEIPSPEVALRSCYEGAPPLRFASRIFIAIVVSLLSTNAWANNIQLFQTVFGTDFVSAGVGGMRNTGGAHTITVTGVTVR